MFNMRLRFEGLFWERGIFWRATSRLKAIEDFNLEHCRSSVTRPQSVLSVHCLRAILCGDTGFQVCEQTTGGASDWPEWQCAEVASTMCHAFLVGWYCKNRQAMMCLDMCLVPSASAAWTWISLRCPPPRVR
jgi:hypothetical protein